MKSTEKHALEDELEYYKQFTSFAEIGASEIIEELLRNSNLGGFLGPKENLIETKRNDYETLRRYGLSYEDILSPLEVISERAVGKYLEEHPNKASGISELYLDDNYHPVSDNEIKRSGFLSEILERMFKKPEEHSNAVYHITIRRLQDAHCPWSNLPEAPEELAKLRCQYTTRPNYEISVENLKNHNSFRFNMLTLHLIKEHKFFEGSYSSFGHQIHLSIKNYYRVEPESIIRTLCLKSNR